VKVRFPIARGLDWAFIACAFSLLAYPAARIDLDKTVLDREKRTISVWPDAALWRRLDPELGRDIEKWFNDRFGGRDWWLDAQARLDAVLNGLIRNDDVFSGREGWLFYNQGGSVQSFQNIDTFTRFGRMIIRKNIVSRSDWLKKLGSSYTVLVVPAKNRIYGEYYPPGIRVVGPVGRAEQMVQNLQSDTAVPIVFAQDDLLEAKKGEDSLLYFQQDTHWTDEGAFVGYQALMRKIQREHPEAGMRERSEFQWERQAERGGDLTHLTRFKAVPGSSGVRYGMLVSTQKFAFLPAPPQLGEESRTVCYGRPFRVWVFMDSFGVALQPFVSATFGEVAYVRSHSFNEYQKAIVAFGPDLVIHEVAERLMPSLLMNQPPLNPVDSHAF
jgi:hypothetical protein